jgi:hypothetical protein
MISFEELLFGTPTPENPPPDEGTVYPTNPDQGELEGMQQQLEKQRRSMEERQKMFEDRLEEMQHIPPYSPPAGRPYLRIPEGLDRDTLPRDEMERMYEPLHRERSYAPRDWEFKQVSMPPPPTPSELPSPPVTDRPSMLSTAMLNYGKTFIPQGITLDDLNQKVDLSNTPFPTQLEPGQNAMNMTLNRATSFNYNPMDVPSIGYVLEAPVGSQERWNRSVGLGLDILGASRVIGEARAGFRNPNVLWQPPKPPPSINSPVSPPRQKYYNSAASFQWPKDWHMMSNHQQYAYLQKYGPPPPMTRVQKLDDATSRYLDWFWGNRKRPWQNPHDDDIPQFWKDIINRNLGGEGGGYGGGGGGGGGGSGGDWRDSHPPWRWFDPPIQPGDAGY